MRKTIGQILKDGKEQLENNNISDSNIDAQLLLMEVLKCDRIKLIVDYKEYVTNDQEKMYMNFLKERSKGKPTQYILGYQEFMGFDFKVNENVLIPRQDTEMLIETILKEANEIEFKQIMDIGTGSGCIPVCLCKLVKEIKAVAVDISEEALKIASNNAILNNVEDKITFINSDLFEKVSKEYYNYFDAIISNPPYIPSKTVETLMTEVKDFEPHLALDGGNDGLEFYRKIVQNSSKFLKSGGYLFFEVGHDQSEEVMKMMTQRNFKDVKIIKDLAGINRVVYGKLL